MTSRMTSDLWVSRDSRAIVNEPKEILLAGTKERSLEVAVESMKSLGHKHADLSPLTHFEQVAKWARDAKTAGRFPHQSEHALAHLRAYTLEHPGYYRRCNEYLYKRQDMSPWLDFVGGICVGIASEIGHRPSPPPRLYRVAWVPTDVFQEHFAEGNEVLFRAFLSASSAVQWQFLHAAHAADPDQTPLLLEWDERAARDAVHIQPYSVFDGEDEYIFRAYWRGIVRSRAKKTSPGGVEVDHIVLDALPQMLPLPKVLNAEETSTHAVLSASALIGLHCGAGKAESAQVLRSILVKLEKSMQLAVAPVEPDGVEKMYLNMWRSSWRVVKNGWKEGFAGYKTGPDGHNTVHFTLLFAMTVCLPTGIPGALARLSVWSNDDYKNNEALDQAAMSLERERRWHAARRDRLAAQNVAQERAMSAVASVAEVLQRAPEVPFEEVLRQIRSNLDGYCASVEDPAEKAVDDQEVDEYEERRILLWARIIVELQMISILMEGSDSDICRVYRSPFPMAEGHLDIAIRVGGDVFEEVSESLPADAAARLAISLVVHARRLLSRMRILVVVGEMDSGKTTLLNRLYNLNLPAGRENSGRTRSISLYSHPRSDDAGFMPVLLADAPGAADKLPARADLIRMMMAIAKMAGVSDIMRFVLVRQSGRPAKAPAIEELMQGLGRDKIIQLVTHVDACYEKLVESKLENLKKDNQANRIREKEVRQELADQVLEDDRLNIGGNDFSYVCLEGKNAKAFNPEEDDGGDPFGSRFPFMEEDLRDFFGDKALSTKALRKKLDEHLGLPP